MTAFASSPVLGPVLCALICTLWRAFSCWLCPPSPCSISQGSFLLLLVLPALLTVRACAEFCSVRPTQLPIDRHDWTWARDSTEWRWAKGEPASEQRKACEGGKAPLCTNTGEARGWQGQDNKTRDETYMSAPNIWLLSFCELNNCSRKEGLSPARCILSFGKMDGIFFSRCDSPLVPFQPGCSVVFTAALTWFLDMEKLLLLPL